MSIFQDLFVFEMANNHQGSVEHGLKIIQEMGKIVQKYGLNAMVKFQYRNLDSFIHPDFKGRDDVKHIPRFEGTRLTDDEFMIMLNEVRMNGMKTLVTPFDEISVRKIVDQNVDVIKVASCSANDWPLLKVIANSGKPVIASTGGLQMKDIDKLVTYFEHKELDFAIMHCVSVYPTPNEGVYLNFMKKMMKRYEGITIGYSGHEAPTNYDVGKIAVGIGAGMLERHVGVETDEIKLNKYSMNPQETEQWVKEVIKAKQICGDGDVKIVSKVESDSLLSLKRGVYAGLEIKKGEIITQDKVFFAMPCQNGQTSSSELGSYRSKVIATKDYNINEPISENVEYSKITKVREIVHEAKGMIKEAGIVLGSDFKIELSHHYGLEQFRKTGTIILDIVNREYCKKILIMLPGQSHPLHRHTRKEETFHILSGQMDAVIDDQKKTLKPGDKLLVERSAWHSFFSKEGAIFEEISTTHYRNDSEYFDAEIDVLDPMERKTAIDEW